MNIVRNACAEGLVGRWVTITFDTPRGVVSTVHCRQVIAVDTFDQGASTGAGQHLAILLNEDIRTWDGISGPPCRSVKAHFTEAGEVLQGYFINARPDHVTLRVLPSR